MNFEKPELVAQIIRDLKDADLLRGPYRALIDGLFNGDPPYTPQEEKENHIQVNVNWKEGTMLLLQARQQYENAFLTTGNFFTVTVPVVPISKQPKVNGAITRNANRALKESRPYDHTQRSKFGSVALHGVGPQFWEDQYAVIPYFTGIEDVLVPTDTLITLENLTHFTVRRKMTPGQLFRKTLAKGKDIDPGWQVDRVKKILAMYDDLNQNVNHWNWYEHPEELTELWRQNGTYYDSDAVPVIKLWDFYYQDDESGGWYRVILPDEDCAPGVVGNLSDPLQFLYKREECFANNLDEIMHVQFGDGNNKPPFMWYSVRSIGWLLFDVVHMMNRLRCQFTQKVFEDLMLLFRVNDPADRSRLDRIYLGLNYGIIPDGLNFVKREERYEPSKELVEMLMSNYKQLMGESSSAYTQDIDQGTPKERTAFEVQALLSQTARLTGSMLNLAYRQEKFAYREICRRLTIPKNPDFVAKRFISACKEDGVAEKYLNSKLWEIEPERVLGQGNMQLEQAQAQGLMSIRPFLSPAAQDRVTHEYVFALTHDPKRTEAIAPLDGAPKITDSVHDTELVFAAFMQGIPITPKSGTNPIEVVDTMLRMFNGRITMIMTSNKMGTPQDILGLAEAAKYTEAYIGMMEQDDANKERVTAARKALGKMMNEVKGMQQRQVQAMQAAAQKNGGDPEAMAKVQTKLAESQVKIQSKKALDAQKLRHKDMDFQATQRRKNLESLGDVQRKTMQATVESHAAMKKAEEKDRLSESE